MTASVLRIRDREYNLDIVLLRVKKEDDGTLVTFDLFADNKDLSRAGFAINSMSMAGTKTADVENAIFELDEDDSDALNELRESVICEPGAVLELSHLKLAFGSFSNNLIDIKLEARCFTVDEETSEPIEQDIPVTGVFAAKLRP